ncbi:hypothetical protein [Paenibacillus larvae]|uniref:hypothetical protein n=1 Tax=Paenibacillus larvae TaxID=1464 RepID=UPI001268D5F9|nr:hypothetical protein [Paenibacillus larvae]MDT2233756.1 hypothetical protein [Paenibacillus larvae]MDT2278678.1 hypothetical protein [Paenibacillus larvae]
MYSVNRIRQTSTFHRTRKVFSSNKRPEIPSAEEVLRLVQGGFAAKEETGTINSLGTVEYLPVRRPSSAEKEKYRAMEQRVNPFLLRKLKKNDSACDGAEEDGSAQRPYSAAVGAAAAHSPRIHRRRAVCLRLP